ncbi:hypothetical protein COCON_G00202330 [Conger conger]|uniref:Uncharacterized protein n=1 Tax=Conger conger TaxID=82655 RepID=A0A9Q1CZ46_CONCO|nr:hypothetical protein COCON_G00202330 [Conger conger]
MRRRGDKSLSLPGAETCGGQTEPCRPVCCFQLEGFALSTRRRASVQHERENVQAPDPQAGLMELPRSEYCGAGRRAVPDPAEEPRTGKMVSEPVTMATGQWRACFHFTL